MTYHCLLYNLSYTGTPKCSRLWFLEKGRGPEMDHQWRPLLQRLWLWGGGLVLIQGMQKLCRAPSASSCDSEKHEVWNWDKCFMFIKITHWESVVPTGQMQKYQNGDMKRTLKFLNLHYKKLLHRWAAYLECKLAKCVIFRHTSCSIRFFKPTQNRQGSSKDTKR